MVLLASGEQTHFSAFVSPAEKIGSAISSCKTISVTSFLFHQSEFSSYFCGANTRGLYVGILIYAFAKVCNIFGFEKLNKHQEEAIRQVVEMKRDVYVNLATGYGKSVVFQALPTVFASVDKCEKNIVIVISPLINLMKDQASHLSLLGVSAISLGDISSATEIKKVEGGEFSIVYRHLNLGLATLDGEECWQAKLTKPM